jgi:hypothetical protein
LIQPRKTSLGEALPRLRPLRHANLFALMRVHERLTYFVTNGQ